MEMKKQQVSLSAMNRVSTDDEKNRMILSPKLKIKIPVTNQELYLCACLENDGNGNSPVKSSSFASPLSPRRVKAREREKLVKKVVKVVSSPVPYCVLGIVCLMIILIFVNVMPIAGLICVIAIIMVLFVVIGNHWKNAMIWEEVSHHSVRSHRSIRSRSLIQQQQQQLPQSHHHSRHPSFHHHSRGNSLILPSNEDGGSYKLSPESPPMNPLSSASSFPSNNKLQLTPVPTEDDLQSFTYEDKIDNLNEFFEDLFGSIDYSLLLIFLGTFIVVENMASTGIPRYIFKSIVGPVPFSTFYSMIGISVFVLLASQLLGNVAVVQLCRPNVHDLNDDDKRFAWALISFISTIGGNLTIAGSAGK
jgi:hypothetical protein